MRHRQKGRKLGRNPSHRRAMLRNMASSLFLSVRDDDVNERGEPYREYDTPAMGLNKPRVKGRITTTVPKAKQVRPLVEKCITIARNGLKAEAEAEQYGTDAERNTEAYKAWRKSDKWQQWAQAMAPSVNARRRVVQLIRNKVAMEILFDEIAPQFMDRDGGYTRIIRVAEVRLGDAGEQAILEFVGKHDRVSQKSERPAFEDDELTSDDSADEGESEDERNDDDTETRAEDEIADEAEANEEAAEAAEEEEKK